MNADLHPQRSCVAPMCAIALSGIGAAGYYACSDPSTHAPTPMPRAALTVCRQLCAALLLLLPSLQGLAQETVAPARVTWLVVVAVCVIGLIVATLYWWDRRPRVAAAALVLLALGAAGLFEWRFREQRANEQRLELLERLGSLRSRLESVIAKNLALTNGLAAFVAANPDLGQEEFDAYARNVLVREPSLRNLAAAPDLVVRYVYPREGNEAVLGLDYRADPAQREVAERVMRSGDLVVAGPVELVQGGTAFIGRAPVYIETPGQPRVTWGLVSAPIDVHKVLQQGGLGAPMPEGLRIAIRGKDGKGERGEVFYGDAGVFDARDIVTTPVLIGGGSWQIGAVPGTDPRTVYGVRVIRLCALVLLALLLLALRATARARAREREYALALQRQANFDPLTGLPNRPLFRQQLESAIARSGRTGARHALLFIDLDEFKSVNDNLGHDAGDQLLIDVGRRICGCVRTSDTVARLSGDEFTAILYDIVAEESISRVAEAIVEALGRAFRIGEREVFCGASVGVAIYPDDASSADSLMIKADQAMYAVKRSGRNGWYFYTREMQEKSERRHRLYNELVAALDDGRIVAHLQPIVSVQTGRIVSCEALARWQREDGAWVSPGEFVPVAEESGLINRVDFVVMQTAIDAVRAINEQLGTGIGLSANVSPRIFAAQNQQIQRWMDTVKAAARELRLTVEITERLLFDDAAEAHKALNELAASGIGISIDDFGTGNASLIHLTRFPVGIIKIDRSFTRAIGLGRAEEALIETILVMAKRLDLRVVAEGVETREQYDYLSARGCDFVQGHFLGRPVDAAQFLEMARAAGTPRGG
jgi:diguanylate cyclase (GGDEF)-like protein